MSAQTRPKNPVARAIKAILLLQVFMAVFLFGRDMLEALPNLGFGVKAPSLDRPVAPGDQTRRFDPRRFPSREGAPGGRPFPPSPEMPDRLQFTSTEIDGTSVIQLEGAIHPGDARRFDDYYASLEFPAEMIYLNSPGGSVRDALLIGRAIRKLEMSTKMAKDDICLSACPYVFSGGIVRSAESGSFIGVHQHYFEENTALPAFVVVEDIQRGQGEVMAYLQEMGVNPLMMQHALVTGPRDIYIFIREELETYKIVTDGL